MIKNDKTILTAHNPLEMEDARIDEIERSRDYEIFKPMCPVCPACQIKLAKDLTEERPPKYNILFSFSTKPSIGQRPGKSWKSSLY